MMLCDAYTALRFPHFALNGRGSSRYQKINYDESSRIPFQYNFWVVSKNVIKMDSALKAVVYPNDADLRRGCTRLVSHVQIALGLGFYNGLRQLII